MTHGDLERSRAAFEAKVRAAAMRPTSSGVGGKGSPAALLAIGTIGTATLGICAALLGGGLLFFVAAVPLLTVVAVLASRSLAR